MMPCPQGLGAAVAVGGWPLMLAAGFVLLIGVLVGALVGGGR